MRPRKIASCLPVLFATLLALSFAGVTLAESPAGPDVVRGSAWALYDVSSVRGEPHCLPYANNGYALEVLESDAVSRRVLVRSTPGDLDCRAVFPPKPGTIPLEAASYARRAGERPELAARSAELTAGSRTQVQAVRRIICWVSREVAYSDGPQVPGDPLDVFRSGTANCVGASELAVALLREAGIPARGVRGFLASTELADSGPQRYAKREQSLGDEGLHRWIEIYYPGSGWVFSDPFRSVDYVGPRYLVFDVEMPPEDTGPARFGRARPELRASASTFIQSIERGGLLVATDRLPQLPAREGMTVRRNGPLQYAPAIVGRVTAANGDSPDEVRLLPFRSAPGFVERVALVRRGVFSFTGLEAGAYRLAFYRDDRRVGSCRTMVHHPPRNPGIVHIDLGRR